MATKQATTATVDHPYGQKEVFHLIKCEIVQHARNENYDLLKVEKLRVVRDNVKITRAQASTLNESVAASPHNQYAELYFLPGEEKPFISDERMPI